MSVMLPALKELTSVTLHVSNIAPPDMLILMGMRKGDPAGRVGMIGLVDLTGRFESWMSDEHVLLQIHGTVEALDYFKEHVND